MPGEKRSVGFAGVVKSVPALEGVGGRGRRDLAVAQRAGQGGSSPRPHFSGDVPVTRHFSPNGETIFRRRYSFSYILPVEGTN